MINDWVNKGHTNLNMFSVVDEQIRSLSSKQSKLNFWNQLHPKIALLCRFWTQTATWRPNHTILTSSVIAILKAMIDTVFLGPSSGGVRIFYERWEFFTTRESTLGPTGWSLSYLKKVKFHIYKQKNIRIDMFLIYVFCVKVFGCQTKAQLLLEDSNFFNLLKIKSGA